MKARTSELLLGLLFAAVLALQGCGGSGGAGSPGPTGGTAPTTKTKTDVAQHLTSSGAGLVANSFTAFEAAAPAFFKPSSSGPVYDKRLGLWVVTSITLSSYTKTFYQDKAETEPAGSAVYTLDLPTQTLSGTVSITAGNYSGLSGNYSATRSGTSISGNLNLTLPSGTTVASQFSITLSLTGKVSGTTTETVTDSTGYSETSTVVRNSDGSMKITASDTNGYSSTLNFASDYSGSGTVNGPDPGLPATVKWDSTGTGTVTFANGLVVKFSNWQFPKP